MSDDLSALIGRARGDRPSPERLEKVHAKLERELGPLPPGGGVPASMGPTWIAGAVVLAAVIALVAWRVRPAETT